MSNGVLLFLNLGTQEVVLIMFAALLLFGGEKLPELARGLGKGIREFKDASDGVKREINRNINELTAKEEMKREEELDREKQNARLESSNEVVAMKGDEMSVETSAETENKQV